MIQYLIKYVSSNEQRASGPQYDTDKKHINTIFSNLIWCPFSDLLQTVHRDRARRDH